MGFQQRPFFIFGFEHDQLIDNFSSSFNFLVLNPNLQQSFQSLNIILMRTQVLFKIPLPIFIRNDLFFNVFTGVDKGAAMAGLRLNLARIIAAVTVAARRAVLKGDNGCESGDWRDLGVAIG
ncbi:hypothetical protein POM88_043051 [Heracleum sosnowskyi]|uniref:Uncharacterized protein n=1 Tax=Heracleum sosnowskyi TaxID=360622 RepID=A0AAD8HHM3_9APIA|nr:hypothetical protein POM88_043051 [Heracleum sosnowskyi]